MKGTNIWNLLGFTLGIGDPLTLVVINGAFMLPRVIISFTSVKNRGVMSGPRPLPSCIVSCTVISFQ